MERISERFDAIKHFVQQNKWQSVLIGTALGYFTKKIYDNIYNRYHCYAPGPAGIPIFGNFWSILFYPQHLYKHTAMTYGPIMMLKLLDLNMILLNDSKLMKQLLRQKAFLSRGDPTFDDKNYSIWSVSLDKNKGILPFIGANYDEWSRRRKHAQSALFKLMTTKKVSNITQDAIDNNLNPYLLNIITNNQLWYPRKLCAYIAMNTIFHVCFSKSVDFNDTLYLEFSNLINESFRNSWQAELFVQLPILRKLNLSIHKKYINIRERRNQIVLDLINERSKIFERNKDAECECFIDSCLQAKQAGKMSQVEIVADTYFLFAAGMDTTSSTLEFGIVLAAKYTNVTTRVRNELLEYHDEMDRNGFVLFNLKRLNKYSLFRAFVYEILRISSVVPIGVEHTNNYKDTWINVGDKKYCIPKKCMVWYNVNFIHKWSNNENWKQNGNDMCLENWLVYDENGNAQFVKNESFVSFGLGRRDCVGRLLALKEISIVLGHLLLNYNLALEDENVEIKANMNITSMVDPPIGVQISKIIH
eukprot:424752_1